MDHLGTFKIATMKLSFHQSTLVTPWSKDKWSVQGEKGPGWGSSDRGEKSSDSFRDRLMFSNLTESRQSSVKPDTSSAVLQGETKTPLELKVSQLQSELLKKTEEIKHLRKQMQNLQIENANLRDRYQLTQFDHQHLITETILKIEPSHQLVSRSRGASEEDRSRSSSNDPSEDYMDCCKLFVNGFRRKTTPQEIEGAFSRIGFKVRAEKPGERRGRRNFAFVVFNSQMERDNCLKLGTRIYVGPDELKLALPIRT